ncbi:MAG TPA: DUF1501 domain-containing protein [Tepidisphaeraceae bacterium]|nr:DUF1501 domain-containing protein [Tepidisphaeraceae bacterium]
MNDFLTTRRLFLQRGLALLAAAPTVPTFLDQTMMALAGVADGAVTQQPSGKDGKVLVIVQLSGGNDGLSTVVPFADDAYYRNRAGIGHAGDAVHKLNDYLGLHPNLGALKGLFDQGRMAIVQGVGYPNPNRSHFRSMDIWHTAEPQKEVVTAGWVGRYFDNACPGADPHVGVGLGEQLPLAMKGDRVTPLSFDKADNYRYRGKDHARYLALNKADALPAGSKTPATGSPTPAPRATKAKQLATPDAQLDFLHRTAMDAQVSSDDILRITGGFRPAGDYPGGEFGNGLRTVAAMIGGGLSTRVYYVTLGGFDTHANQRGRHDQLMQQFAQGIGAFWQDMARQRNDDRVLVMTFSEFGRRVQQNASGGTDHGAAAPMFLFGGNGLLKPGIVGNHPSLTDLDAGDLRYNVDFRNVYATVLQHWLDTPSKPILGHQFKTLPILKA